MTGTIQLYGGESYTLPPLLSWDVTLTGGIPCDSFDITCIYQAEMAPLLSMAWRITLTEGTFRLCAVVDEYEIVQNAHGRVLTLSGRGMAALLLDNESQAVEYTQPTLSEILRNHIAPYGLGWENFQEIRGTMSYTVASSSSQWKALSGFTCYWGGFEPRITPEGVLQVTPWRDSGARSVIDARTPVLEMDYRDKRYGVYSEVLVVDKVRQVSQSVKNEALLQRGGSCRRVLYTPGKSTGTAMRYTGEYQIAQSEKGACLLTVTLPFTPGVLPGDVVRVEKDDIGITGDFYVEEARATGSEEGVRGILTMRSLNQ